MVSTLRGADTVGRSGSPEDSGAWRLKHEPARHQASVRDRTRRSSSRRGDRSRGAGPALVRLHGWPEFWADVSDKLTHIGRRSAMSYLQLRADRYRATVRWDAFAPLPFSRSDMNSAMATVVKWVLARGTSGMIEASITRNPVHPITRHS